MTKAQRTFINLSFTVFVFLFAVSAMSSQTPAQDSNAGQIAGVVLDLNGRALVTQTLRWPIRNLDTQTASIQVMTGRFDLSTFH